MSIINKIEQACLIGRGGAGFPTHIKWRAVKKSSSADKYLIINGAEGEPGVYKDGHIIKNDLDGLVNGIKIASDYIKAKKIYFYLNSKYIEDYSVKIEKSFLKFGLKRKLEIIEKPKQVGYIGGEETTILNIIEGRRAEPRLKPPFPTVSGLFSKPTLINNIETLYNVNLLSLDNFSQQRFYSVNIGSRNVGVYHLPDNLSIKKVLQETGNLPDYDFFVQVGGDASGEVLNSGQLGRVVGGAGSITIHKLSEHQPVELITYYLSFFMNSSCGQCTPCREGTFRLLELFQKEKDLFKIEDSIKELVGALEDSSFCALGSSAGIAISSYFKNVYQKKYGKK